ncbi:MAG: membrane protein [Candidatus Kapaibacterium sp.]|nr:MAG: membrane protein [Candidatus Kapabacteria bacterium]
MLTLEHFIGFLTLTALEIVLGIDNIIFVSIVTERVTHSRRRLARRLGLSLALVFRIALLLGITWIAGLTAPLLSIMGHAVSGRDVILFGGGLFLLAKATREIHHRVEGLDVLEQRSERVVSFSSAITQIVLLDLVFSLDSVITAVGLSQHLGVMIAANVAAMIVMVASSNAIANYLQQHPTLVMLALAFLLMVGFVLVLDGVGIEVSRGYVYTAMAFSVGVEFLNMRRQRKIRLRMGQAQATSMPEQAA